MKIHVKEARGKLSFLLITRRGKDVAYLVRSDSCAKKLPSLKKFRSSIRIKGDPVSKVVTNNRKRERY